MAFIFGTSTNYQTFASILRRVAIGTSLQSIDSVAAGGTGYAVGNILTCSGGTSVIPATIEVLTVGGGGEVLTARIRNAGLYTAAPSDPVSVTGGAGSSATFNLTFDTNGWLDRRSTGCPECAVSATIGAGGTGYTVNDVLTVSGGTFSRPATFRVVTAPAGVVGSVVVVDPGDYTTTPSNPASTTGGTGASCTLNITYGTGEREIILEGEGSGSDEIYVGYRSFFDSGSGARSLCLNGFTGFDPLLTYENQPGRSPGLDTVSTGPDLGGAYLPLTNSTVTWWISVTPRRIVAVARTGTCYANCYLGFINPFATGGEFPYPLCIAGTTSERFRTPGSGNISTSGIADPIRDSTSDTGPMYLRTPSGTWQDAYNSTDATTRSASGTGICVVPTGYLSSVSFQTSDDWFNIAGTFNPRDMVPGTGNPGTQQIRLLPTPDPAGPQYVLFPCTLVWSNGTVPGGIYGELDGVFWMDTNATLVAENRILDGASVRHTVFQSGVRADFWAHWALRED